MRMALASTRVPGVVVVSSLVLLLLALGCRSGETTPLTTTEANAHTATVSGESTSDAAESETSGRAQIGKPFPNFALEDTNRHLVHLSDFDGKPVLVYLCCLGPSINKLRDLNDKYFGAGLVILPVAIDELDARGLVGDGVKAPVLVDGTNKTTLGSRTFELGYSGYPATWALSQEHILLDFHPGLDWDITEKFARALAYGQPMTPSYEPPPTPLPPTPLPQARASARDAYLEFRRSVLENIRGREFTVHYSSQSCVGASCSKGEFTLYWKSQDIWAFRTSLPNGDVRGYVANAGGVYNCGVPARECQFDRRSVNGRESRPTALLSGTFSPDATHTEERTISGAAVQCIVMDARWDDTDQSLHDEECFNGDGLLVLWSKKFTTSRFGSDDSAAATATEWSVDRVAAFSLPYSCTSGC